jgi:hypothetical protein
MRLPEATRAAIRVSILGDIWPEYQAVDVVSLPDTDGHYALDIHTRDGQVHRLLSTNSVSRLSYVVKMRQWQRAELPKI